jgi:transmembrane 9 superfamily protein 3
VAADVFRPPKHLELFSALLGTGAQLVLLVLFVLLFSLVSTWEVGRGRIFTATLFMYALTSASAGYVSGGFYARCNGRHWIKAMLLTASLFPGVVFAMVLSLDVVAMSYGSLAQIPIGTILSVMAIWALLSFPLTLAGTILGRSYAGKVEVPRRVNVIPRDIPERPW